MATPLNASVNFLSQMEYFICVLVADKIQLEATQMIITDKIKLKIESCLNFQIIIMIYTRQSAVLQQDSMHNY